MDTPPSPTPDDIIVITNDFQFELPEQEEQPNKNEPLTTAPAVKGNTPTEDTYWRSWLSDKNATKILAELGEHPCDETLIFAIGWAIYKLGRVE